MKIIVVGDIHGRNNWQQVKNMTCDEIIFVGDYFDSFNIAPIEQLRNFEEIIKFKNDNLDKVTLLLGNHDIHYVWNNPFYRGSGFNSATIYDFGNILNKNIMNSNLHFGWYKNNYLITHAGLVNRFYDEVLDNCDFNEIPEKLLDLTLTNKGRDSLFSLGFSRGGHNIDSPIWCHDRELMLDYVKGLNQIVGHTAQKEFKQIITKSGNQLNFVDCYPGYFEFDI